jgi:hypothetical protein
LLRLTQALKDLYSIEELLPSAPSSTQQADAAAAPAAAGGQPARGHAGAPPSIGACVEGLEARAYSYRLDALYGLLHHCGGTWLLRLP